LIEALLCSLLGGCDPSILFFSHGKIQPPLLRRVTGTAMFLKCRRKWRKDMYKTNMKLPAPSGKLSHIPDGTKRNFRVVKDEKNPRIFCATSRLRFCIHWKLPT
jgi:hypothetical protein